MATILNYKIVKRKFTALNYPKGSTNRAKLNNNPLTSEYMTSYKYIVIGRVRFSHGGIAKINQSVRSKKEGKEFIEFYKRD